MSKTLLLNMIVKNEADIIIETLTNLCDKINFSYWVISDTGSTDNTKELIKDFFNTRGIPGELYEDEWRDFGYNRTKALEHAFNKSDLLMVFDADDQLIGDFKIPDFDFDFYELQFKCATISFFRNFIFNNRRYWKCIGKIHEFIVINDKLPIKAARIFGNYYVNGRSVGARNKNPRKFIDDRNTLIKAYNELKSEDEYSEVFGIRYSHHLGINYIAEKLYDDAIHWFLNVLKLTEKNYLYTETYSSCVFLCELFFLVKKQPDYGILYALKSYAVDNTRLEGMVYIMMFYLDKKMYDIVYSYYLLIKDTEKTIEGLKNTITCDYTFPFIMIYTSIQLEKPETIIKMYNQIFTNKVLLEPDQLDMFIYYFNESLKLTIDKIDITFYNKLREYLIFLEENNVKIRESFYYNIYDISLINV